MKKEDRGERREESEGAVDSEYTKRKEREKEG